MSLHNFFIVIGMALVYLASAKVAKRVGIPSGVIDEILTFVMIPGLFLSLFVARLLFQSSGISSFSYLFTVITLLVLYLICRRGETGSILKLVDVLTFGTLCGWVVVRLGCAYSHDFLAPASSATWYTVTSRNLPFHNLALYESLLTLIFLLPVAFKLLLSKTMNPKSQGGELFITVWILYGAIRFVLEANRAGRTGHSNYGILGPNQYAALTLIFVSLLALLYLLKATKRSP